MPAKKLSTPKKAAREKKISLTSAIGPKATVIVVICVMAGGIAIAARQQQSAKAKDAATPTVAAEVAGTGTSAKKPATASVSTSISDVTLAPAAAKGSSARSIITVTGCLEKTDEGFRLKDTAGPAAPKSRSWKSGFLKKGSASLDVVDASHTLQLGNQVGRRVTLTGSLVDREMRADSVRRVASSCKAN